MNNVLNNKKFKLSHVLGETVVTNKCSLNVTSKLRIIERLMIGCCEQPSDRAVIEMKRLDSYLNESNSYYPFRVTNWSDNEKCKISSYFLSIQDESRYQAADSSGTYNHTQYGLNEDSGLELRQAVRVAQMADYNFDNNVSYRQQFDSISKDFLSAERENFDPTLGSMYQWLKSQVLCSEQKWWSIFGKYWLIKNERNDDDVKLMKWLMTGENHGTINTCGENVSLHCEKMVGRGHLIESQSIDTPAKALKLELGSQRPIKSPFKYSRDVIK